jgi:hypothetical protein
VNPGKSALLIPLALLTACGGGGGKGGSLPPAITPQTKKSGEATFSFKLPGKSTMTKLKRRYYQSQATEGVAIDWTSSNPYAPDYSAPITAACPIPTVGDSNLPPGVTSCTIDANGDTDYTFQLQIPVGTYPSFTVTTFDQAPASGGSFIPSANMLAQGQLAAPVVITAGALNTIPNLTFYGIPASVSFVPGPAQSHVTNYNGGYGIVGNAPQTFFVQAQDADGFDISSNDPGAPVLSVSESSTDAAQYFVTAAGANAYAFTLQAQTAPATMSTAGTINVAANPPAATGLSGVQHAYLVTAIPELWISANNGENSGVINGYALNQNTGYAFQPGPIVDSVTTNYTNYAIAADNNGNLWVANGAGLIQEYNAAVASTPPALGTTITNGLSLVVGLAVDATNRLWIADMNAPDGNGEVIAYNVANPASPTLIANDTATGTAFNTMENPQALGVAPNSTSLPTALRNTVWVSSRTNPGTVDVLTPSSGSSAIADTYPGTVTGRSSIGTISIASNGAIWLDDIEVGNIYLYSVKAGAGLELEQVSAGDMEEQPANGAAADPLGNVWATNGPYAYFLEPSSGIDNSVYINGYTAYGVCLVP